MLRSTVARIMQNNECILVVISTPNEAWMMELKDATAVVTGAARGIGLAVSHALMEAGAQVVMADADAKALMSLPVSDKAIRVPTDVRDKDAVEALAQQAEQAFGPVLIWINNAGLARHRWVTEYDETEIDLMMDVNLKGTVFGCQSALRRMAPRRSGHIINVVSTAALRGIPTESFYCATKWAVRGFTQALSEEAARDRVRVTALLPGGVDTAFWDAARDDAKAPREKFLSPKQVAQAMIDLLRMEDSAVVRELVLRSIEDGDFAVGPRSRD